ncbi:DNA repair protein rhp26 [Coemansia spiralis]|nr:DNA repair protein rhp26 [Coemansia spiralis]
MSEDSELRGLLGLGVRVVGQAEMEDTAHQLAARDMAEQELAVEGKRLVRIETALARKQEQLAKARETAAAASTAARRQAAADRADRLEDEAEQLDADRAEVLARIQAAESRAAGEADHSAETSASQMASMIVPRRRAAAAAERRNRALGHSGGSSSSSSDVSVGVPSPPPGPDGASDTSYGASDGNESAGEETGARITPRGDDMANDIHDDGDEAAYQERVYSWCTARWRSRQADEQGGRDAPHAELMDEPFLPDPGAADHAVKAHDRGKPDLLVPQQIWGRLLEYQKAGLRWLFALHQQGAGGILGDEMGLGKTVQTAAFLGALYHSRLLGRPSIIVCPATLMRQWVRELHAWWPVLRVAILHNTGYAMRATAPTAPAEPARDITTRLPTDEVDVWEAARAADPRFGGWAAGDTSAGDAADYNSADDYEYDAYGSRIRRKRKPRGTLDWRKRQRQAQTKSKPKAGAPNKATRANLQRAQQLVDHVQANGHVVIVTYSGLQVYRDVLLRHKWGYAVLDEGHMVRNPDADVTMACKRLDTRHRLLVTGTPIQNNLTELWSLFDFIFPGRLGTLPVFTNQFAVPITVGGYATANPLQVRAAYRCACILRDLIEPHLLRRLKRDVARDLPKKTEQVLFCRLTPMQRTAYASFLRSGEMERILGGKLQMLFGVDVARKVCDHPDLLLLSKLPSAAVTHREAVGRAPRGDDSGASSDEGSESDDAVSPDHLPEDYGDWRKSGKMSIMHALLEMWKPQGHKVLIFSQTRQMLDIIERMALGMALDYRRMDGTTPIQHRTALVDEYNRTPSIFVFLLTTKVGGLGINLTGADRVILFSPDWNPSSDSQARERAWRLGQRRDVAIYRLMTAGTIEEKIYNRQIYKQFLSSKILEDPRQGRFFHSQSMRDLFSLADFDATDDAPPGAGPASDGDYGQAGDAAVGPRHVTETGKMFAGAQLFPKTRPGSVATPAAADHAPTAGDAAPGTVEAIGGLVRLEPFRAADSDKSGNDGQQRGPEHAQEDGDEDRVLSNLFQISGMHSALQHDAIVNGGDGDAQIIDQEATRIAQDARRALRESQRSRRGDVSIPTWTGASGDTGVRPRGMSVAPPPSAVLSGELPSASIGMVAVGRPQRRPVSPADNPFAAGVSAVRSGGRVSSASLLAGLRAGADTRVGGPPPRTAGTSSRLPVRMPPGEAPAQLLPGPRRPLPAAPGRAFAPRATSSASDRSLGNRRAVPPARPVSRTNDDRVVVERIRELLARHGGVLGNGALLKEFGEEFPLSEQPRLRRLALQVADLVPQPSPSASSTGIGLVVRKAWQLKDRRAERPLDR